MLLKSPHWPCEELLALHVRLLTVCLRDLASRTAMLGVNSHVDKKTAIH